MQTSELIALLHAQAEEIARAGHNGWGNTMTYAAEVLGEYVATLDAIIRREQET